MIVVYRYIFTGLILSTLLTGLLWTAYVIPVPSQFIYSLINRCCKESRIECLACQNRQTIGEYCFENDRWLDFTNDTSSAGSNNSLTSNACCNEKTKECLSCKHVMSVTKFCKENPDQHDCNIDDIMIVIFLNGKNGYTEFTASVIKKYHKIEAKHIHLIYDDSVKFSQKERKWYGEDVRMFQSLHSKDLDEKLRWMLEDFVTSSYSTLFVINSETVFSKKWKLFINENIYRTGGILSLYHSSVLHDYSKDCDVYQDDLCVGNNTGQFGIAFTRDVAQKILKEHENLSTNWSTLLQVCMFYPRKSLTMQIDQTTQDNDNCGQNEVAYRFNRCEFPEWIKNGLEFYFDRCTSPSEIYFAENSTDQINQENRFWVRPAISYSFYGDKPRYTKIALENAARVFSVYPGWKIWIYTDYSVPKSIMEKLCEFDVRFIDMSESIIKSKMSWRFLIASAPVKMYAIRDIDSHLIARGKTAVDEWIASGKKFHVMRDHLQHAIHSMNGGMWGGRHDAVPNMKELLENRTLNNTYMQDMDFLRDVIWKYAKESVLVHDSHSTHQFGEDYDFPTNQLDNFDYVGRIINKNNYP